MNVTCSSKGIINLTRPKQGINDLIAAGFSDIMLNLSVLCSDYDIEHFGEELKEKPLKTPVTEDVSLLKKYSEDFLSECKKRNINNSVVYAPHMLRNSKRDDVYDFTEKLAVKSIEICGEINGKYTVIRPLSKRSLSDNFDFYLRIGRTAKENNIHILIENMCREHNGHLIRGMFFDSIETAEFIDKLNNSIGYDCFGLCMNIAALTLSGQDIREYIIPLGNRIKAVILSDCDGLNEAALLPFTASHQRKSRTDWLGVIRGLRETGFDGELILDISDTAGAFSPLLRPQVFALAKSTADYLKWQIELENLMRKYSEIVLFGAGNMCRNYMKCYSEKYPPLFTCDNNPKLWGTEFCGLTVNSPDALKNIPDNCGIFICNIYYREIEAQLRDMGIKNNIEFFNDEYLPSFYFDRVKRL